MNYTSNFSPIQVEPHLKAAKTCCATLFRCKFSSMFPVFHLAWSNCRATKTFVAGWRKLLRKVKRGSTLSNKFWLCCSFFIKLTTCRATNLLVTWKINQSARRTSSTRNKCFCCGSSWSRQVKNGKHRRKLATKQCCATSWGFLYLVFRRRITHRTIDSEVDREGLGPISGSFGENSSSGKCWKTERARNVGLQNFRRFFTFRPRNWRLKHQWQRYAIDLNK